MDWLSRLKNITTENALRNHLKGLEENENHDFNILLPTKTDNSGNLDFLGVCKVTGSFANTHGGVLYLGVQEKGGMFTDIPGVYIENWERLQKHIHEKLRAVYDPVIEGVSMTRIPLDSGKYVVLITCPISDDLHQLILDGQPAMFPKRVGPNVIGMTAAEIRTSYQRKDKISKITSLRTERVDQLLATSSDFIVKQPSLILHVIPDQSDISLKTSEWGFRQHFRYVLNSLINKDGGSIIANTDRLCAEGVRFFTDPTRHLLIKKTGGLELVCEIESNEKSVIHFGEWTKHSLALISHLLAQLANEASCQSWHFAMTLIGVKGKKLRRGTGMFPFTSHRSLPQDRYELDFVKIDTSISPTNINLQIEGKYHLMLESIWHDVDETMDLPNVSSQNIQVQGNKSFALQDKAFAKM